jgi:hypothetical protein
MWNVHNASKPSAVLERAGLARVDWFQWKRKYDADHPWLPGWLYSQSKMPPDTTFQPTQAMLNFRREARIRATLTAATRSEEQMREAWRQDLRPQVTEALLSYWRRMYKKYDWFDRWLLRGEEPPAEVTVVTAQQAQRCSRAWDFAAFCQRIGVSCNSTYLQWISRRQVPSAGWLKWLFGAPPPAGAFVVVSDLQRLRREIGRKAILRAAGLNSATIWNWEKGEHTREPIKAILAGGKGTDAQGWDELSPAVRQQMESVRQEAVLEACCDRAGLSVSRYYTAMKEAERCGVRGELQQYLNIEGRYGTTKSRQAGLVADNFFIPSPIMLRFREEAEREGAEQKVWSHQGLPGFDEWFLDWTAPKAHRGRRHRVTPGAPAAALERTTPQALHPPPEPKAEVPFARPAGAGKRRKSRGRPAGSFDPEVAERNKQIVEDFRARRYPSITKLAEAYDLDRSRVSHILDEAGVKRAEK